MVETRTILERLYPRASWSDSAAPAPGRLRPSERGWFARLKRLNILAGTKSFPDWLRRNWKIVLAGLVVCVYAGLHVHYYNRLVDMEYKVDVAWAQVETQLQRRYHIQQNLTRIAMDYSEHERELLVQLTEIRGAPEPPAPPARAKDPSAAGSPTGGMPSFQLVAEQYPALFLSQNLLQFSQAIIDTEDQIAAHTTTYNDAVAVYSTALRQFPTNIFGLVCGFESAGYYKPDEAALSFQRVEY